MASKWPAPGKFWRHLLKSGDLGLEGLRSFIGTRGRHRESQHSQRGCEPKDPFQPHASTPCQVNRQSRDPSATLTVSLPWLSVKKRKKSRSLKKALNRTIPLEANSLTADEVRSAPKRSRSPNGVRCRAAGALRASTRGADGCKAGPLMLIQQSPQLGVLGPKAADLFVTHVHESPPPREFRDSRHGS